MEKVKHDKTYWRHRAIILKHLNNLEGKRYSLDELAAILFLGKGDSSKIY